MVSDFNFFKLSSLDGLTPESLIIYPTYYLVGKDFKLWQPQIESMLFGKSPLYYR